LIVLEKYLNLILANGQEPCILSYYLTPQEYSSVICNQLTSASKDVESESVGVTDTISQATEATRTPVSALNRQTKCAVAMSTSTGHESTSTDRESTAPGKDVDSESIGVTDIISQATEATQTPVSALNAQMERAVAISTFADRESAAPIPVQNAEEDTAVVDRRVDELKYADDKSTATVQTRSTAVHAKGRAASFHYFRNQLIDANNGDNNRLIESVNK